MNTSSSTVARDDLARMPDDARHTEPLEEALVVTPAPPRLLQRAVKGRHD